MSGEYKEQLQVFLLTHLCFCDLLLYSLIREKIFIWSENYLFLSGTQGLITVTTKSWPQSLYWTSSVQFLTQNLSHIKSMAVLFSHLNLNSFSSLLPWHILVNIIADFDVKTPMFLTTNVDNHHMFVSKVEE